MKYVAKAEKLAKLGDVCWWFQVSFWVCPVGWNIKTPLLDYIIDSMNRVVMKLHFFKFKMTPASCEWDKTCFPESTWLHSEREKKSMLSKYTKAKGQFVGSGMISMTRWNDQSAF